MKRLKTIFTGILIATLLFTGCGNNNGKVPTSAASSVQSEAAGTSIDQSKLETMWVSGDNVNVREGKDSSSQAVGRLSRGAEVKRIAVYGDWTEILFGGESRYISTKFLTSDDPSKVGNGRRTHSGDGFVVCIDPGHQSRGNSAHEPIGPGASTTKAKVTGGTTGVTTGIPEYQLTLDVGLMLQKELESRGYQVIMTRTSNNVNISNSERAAVANNAGADAFIRIHANGGGASSQGALTMCQTAKNPFNANLYNESYALSQAVLKNFVAATGAKNLGVSRVDNMSGINWCQVPVTIIEMGFMSNAAEDRNMADPSYRQKMVLGMANGIDEYLNR